MRTCKWCGNDISHMRANATFCSDEHRYNSNNAQRTSKAVSVYVDAVSVISPSPASPDAVLSLLRALLDEQRLTNQLLMRAPQITVNNVAVASASAGLQYAPPPSTTAIPDLLEVTAARGGNAHLILPLQAMLVSNEANIKFFTIEQLELVMRHPAFKQELIQAEIQRRAKDLSTPNKTIKEIKGSQREFSPPDFDDIDLL